MRNGRFQKGRSGNPGGRPKVIAELQHLARQHTAKAMNALVALLDDPQASASARVAAASVILDRGYGRATQLIETHSLNKPVERMTDEELEAIARGDDPSRLGGEDEGSTEH